MQIEGNINVKRTSFGLNILFLITKIKLIIKIGIKYSILQDKICPRDKNKSLFLLYKSENNAQYVPKIAKRVEYEYGITKEKVEFENKLTTIKIMLKIRETFFAKKIFKM